MSEAADTKGDGGAAVFSRTTRTEQAPRHTRRVVRLIAAGLGACLLLYGAGFVLFLADISQYRASENRSADGIVVLTGGHARIDEAVKLLNDGKGERLLISGVYPATSRAVLTKTFAVDEARFACCVDIDHEALDTIGNATETAEWASGHDYDSLLVVTNDYHMPRSLLELRNAMPGVELIPHAVVSVRPGDLSVVENLARYRVLVGEYLKYSAALLRTQFIVQAQDGAGPRTYTASQ